MNGYTSVLLELLMTKPAEALADLNSAWADLVPVHLAALNGRAAVPKLLLAAAPAAATRTCTYMHDDGDEDEDWSVMHSAAMGGSTAVIEPLVELQPAMASWASAYGDTPLQATVACSKEHPQAAELLLRAAPQTASTADSEGKVPLHWAAFNGSAAALDMLLGASPGSALMEDAFGQRPFHSALLQDRLGAAAALLPLSGLGPAQLLDALGERGPAAQSLHADLAAHFPLSAADWQRVPAPCAGLGRALPAVLARSDAEAALLVQRLPADDAQRLRLAALCVGRVQRRRHVFLPAPLVRAILAQCL